MRIFETARRVGRRIRRELCRHDWRSSRAYPGQLVCKGCGKRKYE